MGIYDRDYYRDEKTGFHPFNQRMQACTVLIVLYVALFLLQFFQITHLKNGVALAGPITAKLVLVPELVVHGEPWRIETYQFLHDPERILPLLFSVVLLLWIGRQLEDVLGWKEFLTFYLLAGLLGASACLTAAILADETLIQFFGPSCSVLAILVLSALRDSDRKVLLFFVMPVPIWVVVVLYFLADLLGGPGKPHLAVFAGDASALLFTFAYHKMSWHLAPSVSTPLSGRRRKLHVYDADPVYEPRPRPIVPLKPAPPDTSDEEPASAPSPTIALAVMDEHLEAKLDAVLEKVRKQGQDSLTLAERETLMRASEVYKKKRKPR